MAKKKYTSPANKKIVPPVVVEKLNEDISKKFMHIELATAADKIKGRRYVKLDMKKIYRLCILGMSNEELAEHYDIDYDMWMAWLRPESPNFKEQLSITLASGREDIMARVADRLVQRALGYKHKAKKFFYNSMDDKIVEQEYTERYPPSEAAAMFILKNKRPQNWKDKQIIEGADGGPVMIATVNVLTDSKKIDKLLADRAEAEKNKTKK